MPNQTDWSETSTTSVDWTQSTGLNPADAVLLNSSTVTLASSTVQLTGYTATQLAAVEPKITDWTEPS